MDKRVQTDGSYQTYRTEDELARGLVKQWMNSPDHRDIILTPELQKLGAGVHITEEGKVYATQNFR